MAPLRFLALGRSMWYSARGSEGPFLIRNTRRLILAVRYLVPSNKCVVRVCLSCYLNFSGRPRCAASELPVVLGGNARSGACFIRQASCTSTLIESAALLCCWSSKKNECQLVMRVAINPWNMFISIAVQQNCFLTCQVPLSTIKFVG